MSSFHANLLLIIFLSIVLGFLLGFEFYRYGARKGWDKGMKQIGYTILANDGSFDGKPIHLMRYSGRTVADVHDKVLAEARREGYKGDIQDRLCDLFWTVVPVFAED